ncbi:hypothetical protein C8F01DRAFT_953979, partial [Mycena amicta]
RKPRGSMYALGWHNAQERNKTLAAYAHCFKDAASQAKYVATELVQKLPKVAAFYRHGLSCLFPGGAQKMQDFADKHGVLSFGDLLDGDHTERPFANSLTATREGFSNFGHRDNDATAIAYGFWFPAKLEGDNNKSKPRQWSIGGDDDNAKTAGGEFIWHEYGIGVDFQRAKGLVEIYWRGQLDFHGTLQSVDEEAYTRFGTSVQITTKGVNAMAGVWNVE